MIQNWTCYITGESGTYEYIDGKCYLCGEECFDTAYCHATCIRKDITKKEVILKKKLRGLFKK